jgi:hypothetical protein
MVLTYVPENKGEQGCNRIVGAAGQNTRRIPLCTYFRGRHQGAIQEKETGTVNTLSLIPWVETDNDDY